YCAPTLLTPPPAAPGPPPLAALAAPPQVALPATPRLPPGPPALMHSPHPPGGSGLFCGAGFMPADGLEGPTRCAVPTRAGRDKPGPTGWPACQLEACAWASSP